VFRAAPVTNVDDFVQGAGDGVARAGAAADRSTDVTAGATVRIAGGAACRRDARGIAACLARTAGLVSEKLDAFPVGLGDFDGGDRQGRCWPSLNKVVGRAQEFYVHETHCSRGISVNAR